MPNPELALNANMYIAGATLILAYILIFSEVIVPVRPLSVPW